MPDRGDLLLVPSIYRPVAAVKRRPVPAITATDGYGDFIALPVTSRPQTEHSVALTAAGLVSGSLPAASWIRTNRVVTLNSALVVKTVGRVSDAVVAAAVARLIANIGASK